MWSTEFGRQVKIARWDGALCNAVTFLAGAGLIVILIAAWIAVDPPDFAHPSQAAALRLTVLAPILLLGALGVYLSIRSRMTPDPLGAPRAGHPVTAAVGSGIILGLIAVGLDLITDFSGLIAQRLGIDSIHIDFPDSVFVYLAGAVVVECLYRLIPISIIYFLVARLVLRGRGEGGVFWVLAVLTSFVEPLSQAGLAGERALIWLLCAVIFAFNLVEALLWRRYGWISLLLSRLTFYLIWHVMAGPAL